MTTGISDRWANNKHTVDDSRKFLEEINDVGSERGSVSQGKGPVIRRKRANLTRRESERTMFVCALFSRNTSQVSLGEYRVLIIEIKRETAQTGQLEGYAGMRVSDWARYVAELACP
jgi:hypothetical protein